MSNDVQNSVVLLCSSAIVKSGLGDLSHSQKAIDQYSCEVNCLPIQRENRTSIAARKNLSGDRFSVGDKARWIRVYAL